MFLDCHTILSSVDTIGRRFFVEDADYQYYLHNLAEWKAALGLQVFSYCLMINHVHLIIRANGEVGSIGNLMKRLAGRQTRWVNRQEYRTGSLWESCHKVSYFARTMMKNVLPQM